MVTFKVNNLKNMSAELKRFVDFLRVSGATDDEIFASRLVSCELITNVICHGGDEANFEGGLSGDVIAITVSADSLKHAELEGNAPDVFAESGRGLYIVKYFSETFERGTGGEVKVTIRRDTKA